MTVELSRNESSRARSGSRLAIAVGTRSGVISFDLGKSLVPNKLCRFALAICLVGGLASAAEAQIYSWRDANGTLVLSDRRLNPHARTFAVVNTPNIRVTRAGARYDDAYDRAIEVSAATHGVRSDLVRAVIQVESGFNPRAVSAKGARGLMQLMPATARDLGVKNVFDPEENIRGGVAYLRLLLDRYNGNEELALAAYNAGAGAVERYGNQVPPYQETRAYVRKILSVTAIETRGSVIYKIVELIDGREVPRYSNAKPAGEYEVVKPPRVF